MNEPLITRLEAFNRDGIHCGSAELNPDGHWRVRVSGMKGTHECETEQAAHNFLQAYGAATIQQQP
jgi:hypothetical protein